MLEKTLKRLTAFDIFPKVDSTYKRQTSGGGFVSVVVIWFLSFLFLSELMDYFSLHHYYEFLVDNSIQGKLLFTLDITIAMKCQYLILDASDNGGSFIDTSESFQAVDTILDVENTEEYAHDDGDLEINNIIKKARQKRSEKAAGWSTYFQQKNACRIRGSVELNRVAGKVYIEALGHGNFGPHVDHSAINLTHHIHRLQFGNDYPGLHNPLDFVAKVSSTNFATYDYFLSVVPTIYIDRHGNTLLTNQYAVTEHKREYDVEDQAAVKTTPGIFFKYDLEPISVRITEQSVSFTRFLLRVFAIMGGIWQAIEIFHRVTMKVIAVPIVEYKKN